MNPRHYLLDDLRAHLGAAVVPAGPRYVVVVCGCGWRSPKCKRISSAMRLLGQLHLAELEHTAEASRCNRCRCPLPQGGLCQRCRVLDDIFHTPPQEALR